MTDEHFRELACKFIFIRAHTHRIHISVGGKARSTGENRQWEVGIAKGANYNDRKNENEENWKH